MKSPLYIAATVGVTLVMGSSALADKVSAPPYAGANLTRGEIRNLGRNPGVDILSREAGANLTRGEVRNLGRNPGVDIVSREAYDCSHHQEGIIAINPCTGNEFTEITDVACDGTITTYADGTVIDFHRNTDVQGVWTDTVTADEFDLQGKGIVVFRSEPDETLKIGIDFKGKAKGCHGRIKVDWTGLITINPDGSIVEEGDPGPSFSDGLTCKLPGE